MDVTVQRKLTEPVAPDEDVAVTVTSGIGGRGHRDWGCGELLQELRRVSGPDIAPPHAVHDRRRLSATGVGTGTVAAGADGTSAGPACEGEAGTWLDATGVD